jgi:hypothetical protein
MIMERGRVLLLLAFSPVIFSIKEWKEERQQSETLESSSMIQIAMNGEHHETLSKNWLDIGECCEDGESIDSTKKQELYHESPVLRVYRTEKY